MKQQIIELLNIKKLNKETQEKAIAAFDKLLLETGHPDDSLQMRVLIHALSGHKLNEDIQTALRNRIGIIIEYERHNTPIPADMFKWSQGLHSSPAPMINEDMFKKDYFRWGKNDVTVKTDGGTDKIKISNYNWKE